jgi:predicted Zn-dependent peptidase
MKSGLLLALLLAASSLVPAQDVPAVDELRFPPLKQVEIPKIETYTLPNGMRLYLMENRELPLIGGFALVRTGNLFDPPDKIGLASLTGDVLRTGGTTQKTGDEIDEQLENLAASVESGIGETSGTVSFNSLRQDVDEVLSVFKDLLTAPAFRQDKLDLAKTQYRSLIARRNDDAGSIAAREFSEIIYGRDNPYGWRMEYEHLERISREDLVAFHRRYFFPANILLAVQGDFSAAEMRAKIEKLFADWQVRQPPVPPFPEVRARPAPGVYLAEKQDVNQTFFRIGHLGGLLRDPDFPALEVMADILGGGFSSRLFAKVRTQLGYAYSVGAAWGANYNHPGLFRISGSTRSEATTETIRAILEEIERLRSSEVSDEELKTAQDTVLNSFVFNFDQPAKTLNRVVLYDYYGYPKDFIFKYQSAVAAVTKKDILRVAQKYLRPQELTIVAVGKPSDFGTPLAELKLPVHKIDLTIPEPKRQAARADALSLARGKQLLERAQQAVGGADKLGAVKDLWISSEIVLLGAGGGMRVEQTSRWLAPSTIRQDQQLPFGRMSSYSDGQTGWLATPQGVQPMPAPVLRQARSALLRLLPSLLASDRFPDRQVNLVGEGLLEIQDGSGESVRLKIDAATGLPAALSYAATQAGGPPATAEETLEDWREVEGLKMPFKITIRRDGAPYAEVTVREIRLNTGVTSEELSRKP